MQKPSALDRDDYPLARKQVDSQRQRIRGEFLAKKPLRRNYTRRYT